ncbi:MAG: hypothetical protein WKF89_15590 [Chitinophagaceae bacterium]
MPKSTQRHKHHTHADQHTHHAVAGTKSKRSAALLMAIFIGFVALAISAFASGTNSLWMVGSTILGVVAGALIGHKIDKSIEKK